MDVGVLVGSLLVILALAALVAWSHRAIERIARGKSGTARGMLREMRNSRTGAFYFRKGRRITNRIPYMRWSQAWAFNALTSYRLHRGGV